MLLISYDPVSGWSAPEIKPYGPLSIDPASSCLQYCPNIFEGLKVCDSFNILDYLISYKNIKAYLGPDEKPRLFRPDMNMARMARSAARVALPVGFCVPKSYPYFYILLSRKNFFLVIRYGRTSNSDKEAGTNRATLDTHLTRI
jgi:hypothetical protein